jgi:fatty acid desaturase
MKTNYRSILRVLPREVQAPYPLRLVQLAAQSLISSAAVWAIVNLSLAWPVKLLLSLVIGHCWGMNGLGGHEILHGSVVRNRKLQSVLGFFCFLPFLISPTFWRFWHNNLHHANTQMLLQDPDAYPTLRIFKQSRFMKWMFPYSPGSGYKRSYLYFFFWFSFNVHVAQFYFRSRNKMFNKLNHRQVNYELALAGAVLFAFLYWAGAANWLWMAVIPFLVLNYSVFSYISTNHNLNPLTTENDPLINSLTVTNHPILEALHLNFGYHVEHHLFPTINGVHNKKIHELLKKHFATTYQYMPKWQAIRQLYATSRIYKTHTTLIHPETLEVYSTLGGLPDATNKGVERATTNECVLPDATKLHQQEVHHIFVGPDATEVSLDQY